MVDDVVVAGVVMMVVMEVVAAASATASRPAASRLLLLLLLSLVILLAFHAPVLEPDLDLTFREVKVPGQLPSLLLGHVGVEQELLF